MSSASETGGCGHSTDAPAPTLSAALTDEDSLEFIECARYGELEDAAAYLHDGVDVNFCDASGSSALHKSAANGHVDVVRLLASRGAKFTANSSGNTPLHWAVLNGQTAVIALLMELYDGSVDVLAKNAFGKSALTEALNRGDEDIARLMLNHRSVDASIAAISSRGGGAVAGGDGESGAGGPEEEEAETDDDLPDEDEDAPGVALLQGPTSALASADSYAAAGGGASLSGGGRSVAVSADGSVPADSAARAPATSTTASSSNVDTAASLAATSS